MLVVFLLIASFLQAHAIYTRGFSLNKNGYYSLPSSLQTHIYARTHSHLASLPEGSALEDKGPIPGKPLTALIKRGTKAISYVAERLPGPVKDVLKKVDNFVARSNLKEKMSKEELAKLGLYALLSYGFVSNFSYITCVIISWCMHGKATGTIRHNLYKDKKNLTINT